MTTGHSKMAATLELDGAEVADGSVEIVKAYIERLRAAAAALDEARRLVHHTPHDVEDHWRKLHDDADKKLSKLIGPVARFADDYEKRGLEVALSDAHFRKELP